MLTLPIDSTVRKTYPIVGGLFGYFAAALAGVAHHSWKSNERHNKGQPLHWSMDKSNDHAECVGRHLIDLHEMLANLERAEATAPRDWNAAIDSGWPECHNDLVDMVLTEADALAWRALALSQTLRMKYKGAPLPFNARRSEPLPSDHGAAVQPGGITHFEGYPSLRCTRCQTQPCSCGHHSGH